MLSVVACKVVTLTFQKGEMFAREAGRKGAAVLNSNPENPRAGGLITAKKRASGEIPYPFRDPVLGAEARRNSIASRKGMPMAVTGNSIALRGEFRSFASKIRHQTNDGWELIQAVYEVFSRAVESKNDGLIIESATWLADRGFGKPVQVGALMDGDGNPVAFTLWQPAVDGVLPPPVSRQPVEDARIIDMEPGQGAVPSPVPSNEQSPPPTEAVEVDDEYAKGLAHEWTVWEKQPKLGE